MKKSLLLFSLASLLFVVGACGTNRQLKRVKENKTNVSLNLPRTEADFTPEIQSGAEHKSDSIIVTDESGKQMLLLSAVKDEATGEMVAVDTIQAAIVTGRFKRVAERKGKIDLQFEVNIPSDLVSTGWQLTILPEMYLFDTQKKLISTSRLDVLKLTGRRFRRGQERGYQRYERYVNSLIVDTMDFKWRIQLESFLKRNIPAVYAYKNDTSFVSEQEFASHFGVNEREAIRHYTRQWQIVRNDKRVAAKDAVFQKLVPDPIGGEGVRLDTVMVRPDGMVTYLYTQTIDTKPNLRKAYIYLSGDIHNPRYPLARTDSLEYNISTLSSFSKDLKRFAKKIVYRRAEANASFNIHFPVGKYEVDPEFDQNARELSSIQEKLDILLANTEFDLDSIVVTANSSPEGTYAANDKLSKDRSKSVTAIFDKYVRHYVDSVNAGRGMVMDLDGNMVKEEKFKTDIRFVSKNNAENWDELDLLVEADSTISQKDKAAYFALQKKVSNKDTREFKMKSLPSYKHIREDLYPKLRSVNFNFQLHRKGMVKDTIQTTEPDTVYAAGLKALNDTDYKTALAILENYPDDYNLAVAYVAMDRNLTAREILERSDLEDADVNYLLAVVYSRMGETQKAVQCYLNSVKKDQKFKYRGNLDPEISVLIKRFNLNKEDDYDF